MSGDFYVIGDIHGCLAPLKRLLEHLEPDLYQDRLLFVGDYIDRGPDSRRVVDYILKLRARYPCQGILSASRATTRSCLRTFSAGRNQQVFLLNGGRSTLADYWGEDWARQSELNMPLDHQRFYQELLPFYTTDDYIFVHGGLKPGVPLEQQAEEDLFWIRGEFIAATGDLGRRVIFGHTPFKQPLILPNKIGIDTGLVYGNYLTCLEAPRWIFILRATTTSAVNFSLNGLSLSLTARPLSCKFGELGEMVRPSPDPALMI